MKLDAGWRRRITAIVAIILWLALLAAGWHGMAGAHGDIVAGLAGLCETIDTSTEIACEIGFALGGAGWIGYLLVRQMQDKRDCIYFYFIVIPFKGIAPIGACIALASLFENCLAGWEWEVTYGPVLQIGAAAFLVLFIGLVVWTNRDVEKPVGWKLGQLGVGLPFAIFTAIWASSLLGHAYNALTLSTAEVWVRLLGALLDIAIVVGLFILVFVSFAWLAADVQRRAKERVNAEAVLQQ
jgi:hypothetical protein